MRKIIISVASCAVFLISCSPRPATVPPAIEERLQKVEDRQAIEALIIGGYSTALDTGDWTAFGNLFTEDGVLETVGRESPVPFASFKGREAISKAFTGPPPGNAPKEAPKMDAGGAVPVSARHIITNPTVVLKGDRATATTYLIEEARTADGKVIKGIIGHYFDELRRINGKWYIARRVIYDTDLPNKQQRPNSAG